MEPDCELNDYNKKVLKDIGVLKKINTKILEEAIGFSFDYITGDVGMNTEIRFYDKKGEVIGAGLGENIAPYKFHGRHQELYLDGIPRKESKEALQYLKNHPDCSSISEKIILSAINKLHH